MAKLSSLYSAYPIFNVRFSIKINKGTKVNILII